MSRKAKLWIGMAIVFALLTPQFLFAQDVLSLESLSARIDTLFQGQNDANERISALETRLAPTPTKTRQPTRTPTPTRQRPPPTNTPNARATQAAQARATSQVRITATAQAVTVRLTTTARARAASQLSEVEYLEVFTEQAELVTMAMDGLTMSFRRPQPSDSNWRELLNLWLETFPYVQQNIAELVPPSSLKRGHDTFLRGIAYCVTGADLVAEGVKTLENSKFTEAAGEFEDCTQITAEALNIVGR